ncbi:rhodanese-like domain-containing protein [Oleiagrimonas sp.]|jgi:rhodanese-related sulfurtransferase|uniref:rhodanese-like domain-containing protein n=1 Tax=Oleiagrimonas sp. TaxID=2010330 RepID=UPI00260BA4D5|nr:rhodanese-like domain-containing protein [Oleiagrimonas sp.]MDA3913346.1 rhodanese-like domain-containing protein [Oleiagrimonas sp.]
MNDFLHKLPEFVGHHPWLSLLFVILLAAIIVGELMRLMRKYKELTPATLTQMINRENALVIDISSYADFEKAHVPGARHVAMSQFDPENKDLAKARDLPVVVVCKTGQTASKAALRLVKAGFTKVFILHGGMYSWNQANMPTAKGRG